MKFSLNWLREFVELPPSTGALAELLTMSGIEINRIEQRGGPFENVVVAQIVASKQHPNADRLSVCEVDEGGGTRRQIVCGAKNYSVGDKVPLALPGAELTNGLKIRASKLRGVESNGMLCSAIELGLGADASGLLILSPETKIGAPLREIFPPDTILDVEITPNRGDLLSHLGLAREISALTSSGAKSRDPVEVTLNVTPPDLSTSLRSARDDVRISARVECPFYSIQRIENVRVGATPDWLRAKIETVGLRSINNVVDISNFVMLELGQPTHAFDAATVRGDINVRLAHEGEQFLALDGRTYSLRPNHLVIADSERAIGLGGVMGGQESGVSETTTTVLLESAFFLPGSIRRTARELNLPSDASYRFERGVDPQMILRASQRATALICDFAGGIARELSIAGELPANPADVLLRYARVNRVLGAKVEPKEADEILTRFGLGKAAPTPSTSTSTSEWQIPSYRRDLQREIDLIEEIARAHGIDKIPGADRSRFTPLSPADRRHDFEAGLRRELVALGLNEGRTSVLISRSDLARANGAVELRNPLTEDHVALRTSLVPGLLGSVARNARAGAERIALFEIGNVFAAATAEQRRTIAIALSGNLVARQSWRGGENRRFDFFDLKGVVEALFATGEDVVYRRVAQSGFALAAEISFAGKTIGTIGQLVATEAKALDANAAVLVGEIDVAELARMRQTAAKFTGMERYPAVRRDVAMFVPETVTHEEISRVISSANEPLLERWELFDLFSEKDNAPSESARKSLAYSLTYRDKNRTLTSEEVSAAHARIRERLRKEIGAQLRE
jgi:phenylalanyl-tRNA synthetase beta chain